MTDLSADPSTSRTKGSTSIRFARRFVLGLLGVSALVWLAVCVERLNWERGIENSKATGLSALAGRSVNAFMIAGGVPQQARLNQLGISTQGRQISRTASLRVTTNDFSGARESVDQIVKTHSGFVASMTISSPKNTTQSLSADLTIPAAQCDAALEDLRKLGRVNEERQGAEEVTTQSENLDIRLRNARETEDRLVNILRIGTGKVGDVLQVEEEIARVRGEVEGMEAERKRLDRSTIYASIELNLDEEYQAEPRLHAALLGLRARNALIDGYHAAADGLLSAILLILSSGPSMILWGLILFWPARWVWRRWRNSRAQASANA